MVVNIFGSVEMGHALTTKLSREQILMVIDDYGDTIITESIDKSIDLVQVFHVVDTWYLLDRFPHDSETNNLGSPILHVLQILIRNRHIEVE